jgi:hypothetical protein
LTIPTKHRALSSGALAPGAGTPHGAESTVRAITVGGHVVAYRMPRLAPVPVAVQAQRLIEVVEGPRYDEIPIPGKPGWYRLQLRKEKQKAGRKR